MKGVALSTLALFLLLVRTSVQHDDISRVERERRFIPNIIDGIFGFFNPRGPQDTGRCRDPVIVPLGKADINPEFEHLLSYFREDIGVNMHHWTWHLTYPYDGPIELIDKDRRGELFYYLHQQILARYNFERFSCGVAKVKPYGNFHEPLLEGYTTRLDPVLTGGVKWPPRLPNSNMSDYNRQEQPPCTLEDMDRWRGLNTEGVAQGYFKDEKGAIVELNETSGIDILLNTVESNPLSVNQEFYGSLHNYGHIIISAVHDPDGKRGEIVSVMYNMSTSMRDPSFYRWHASLDLIFQDHKTRLPSYTQQQLGFDGVQVKKVSVQTKGHKTNEFSTFLQQTDVNLTLGLNFNTSGPPCARYTHLQHKPFWYHIEVHNNGTPRAGTVRIFMAPTADDQARPIPFDEQKLLFIELDKFQVDLRSGRNLFKRMWNESSVTIPFARTFRTLRHQELTGDQLERYYYCGCGWPQHLLIPRGRPDGLPAKLFVMVSDYSSDKVDQAPGEVCTDGPSYCGIYKRKYPDLRAMGYPFDRKPRQGVDTLANFLTLNMAVQDVLIRFHDVVLPPGPNNGATV